MVGRAGRLRVGGAGLQVGVLMTGVRASGRFTHRCYVYWSIFLVALVSLNNRSRDSGPPKGSCEGLIWGLRIRWSGMGFRGEGWRGHAIDTGCWGTGLWNMWSDGFRSGKSHEVCSRSCQVERTPIDTLFWRGSRVSAGALRFGGTQVVASIHALICFGFPVCCYCLSVFCVVLVRTMS